MELEKAIEKVLDGYAVLFAGAGFSYGAKNKNKEVPTAKKLKTDLLEDMGMDKSLEHGLEMCHAARKMQLNHKQNVSSEQSRIIPNICEFE